MILKRPRSIALPPLTSRSRPLYILWAALVASLFSPQALASAKDFAGFSLGMDLNSDDVQYTTSETKTAVKDGVSTMTRSTHTGLKNFLNLGLTGVYRHAITDQFLMGLGAQIYLTDSYFERAENIRYTDQHTVFVTPGYAISKTTLVYGKLGLTSRTLTGENVRFARRDQGTQYGVGATFALSPQWHWNIEYAYTDFDIFKNLTTDGPDSKTAYQENIDTATLSIGLSYRF